ncbi:MAG: CDP-alcohol phosphatidyltransferase family protein [candidate division NC10 bacterium]|nr:CDP-alcohol phosphatidyltransferase family protein [candidate division NC10 bacterium]
MVTLALAKPECLTLRLSRPVTRLLLRTPLTPNQVTALNLLVGLAALGGFAMGGIGGGVAGALLLQVYYILDHCDGEMARARGLTSPSGFWFDRGVDLLVHALLFPALALMESRRTGEVIPLWLGGIAAAAIAAIFGVFAGQRLGTVAVPTSATGRAPRLRRTLQWLAAGDFSLLVLLVILLDLTRPLLWAAAGGAPLYLAAIFLLGLEDPGG